MRRHEKGYSFVELLIVMLIIGFVLAGGSDMIVSLLRGYKQQSKISETNIEGIISLELLRRDIESAGYGLPWVIPSGTTYQEAQNAPASAYNDSTANPPRALLSGFDAGGRAYLVVKAVNLANNDLGGNNACAKWTTLLTSGGTTSWDPSTENLSSTDRIIVISPGATAANSRSLVGPSGSAISLLKMSDVSALADFNETRIVYGVAPADGTNPLRMPFNRADYYVSTTVVVPGRCAPGTGVLVKSTVSQADGGLTTVPLFDCVADMQVVTYLDTNADGSWDIRSNGLAVAASATAAQTIRDQLKEVHVFILAHEGQRDTSYTNTTNPILVGESVALGRNFDLSTITDWQNYRWKVYTLVMRPNNLR
jgi:prepilin-type N-terminal cleavage/methylation domain-containing protein